MRLATVPIWSVAALLGWAACSAVAVEQPKGHSIDTGEIVEKPVSAKPKTMAEEDACRALVDAYHHSALAIGCAVTTRICPNYVRVAHGACAIYDRRSVEECIGRYRAARDCDALYEAGDCPVETVEPDPSAIAGWCPDG